MKLLYKYLTSNKSISFILLVLTVIVLQACTLDTGLIDVEQKSDNHTDFESATVSYVIDGDTFDVTLEDGSTERVRLILVNTPEICHASSDASCESEPYGEEAAVFLEQLLAKKRVYLEQDVSERDPYGRLLAYVYLKDRMMVQEALLAEGLAKIAVYEPDTLHQDRLEAVEEKAKAERLNLWSE